MKRLLIVVVMVLVAVSAQAQILGESKDEQNKKQIEFLRSIGTLKYANQVDASGSRPLLIMQRDNTGVFTHQYLTASEGTNIEEVMKQRGLIQMRINKKTDQVEPHVMVFNPKDNNTYVWVPLSEARETAKRIQETGKTLPVEPKPRRMSENDLKNMDLHTSF